MKLSKKLIVFIVMVLSFNVYSETSVNIFKGSKNLIYDEVKTKIKVNQELSRVWIEAYLIEDSDESFELVELIKIKVPNLIYEKDKKEVVYYNNGNRVVCANVNNSISWIGTKVEKVLLTVNCRIDWFTQSENYDDGFYVTEQNVLKLELTILD